MHRPAPKASSRRHSLLPLFKSSDTRAFSDGIAVDYGICHVHNTGRRIVYQTLFIQLFQEGMSGLDGAEDESMPLSKTQLFLSTRPWPSITAQAELLAQVALAEPSTT